MPETLNQTLLKVIRKVRNPFPTGAVSKGEFISQSDMEFDDWIWYYITSPNGFRAIHKRGDVLDVVFPFNGTIYGIAIPTDFIELVESINAFVNSPGAKPSDKTSEQVFGSYAWTRGTNSRTGAPLGWEDIFADALSAYRYMFWPCEVIY